MFPRCERDATAAIARYLERRAIHRPLHLVRTATERVGQVVVIPVLAESKRLPHTLDDLAGNPHSELERTLIVCVVNNRAEPYASRQEIDDNHLTLAMLQRAPSRWPALRLAVLDAASPGREMGRREGVGTARRLGLDAAMEVLAANHRPQGLLISLDADTRVETGYLEAIRHHFERRGAWAGVVEFTHPLPADRAHRLAIAGYELFLRYHVLGLALAGSPYAHHSVGSTMVCRADAYAAVGGMCRRQAGEDFYFLQQLAKTGGVDRITTTTVRPSSRSSRRVPFGTGATVARRLAAGGAATPLYDPRSYVVVGRWLSLMEEGMGRAGEEVVARAAAVEPELERFLDTAGFVNAWERIHRNSNKPDPERLRAQLHRWFDGFRTLKLIHHLREHGHADQPPSMAVPGLFEHFGRTLPGQDRWAAVDHDPEALAAVLERLRDQERDLGDLGALQPTG